MIHKIATGLCLLALATLCCHGTNAWADTGQDSTAAMGYYNKALNSYRAGNMDSAAFLFAKAAPFFEQAGMFENHVNCHNALVNIAYRKGDYQQVKKHTFESWEKALRLLNGNESAYVSAMQNLSVFYSQNGLYTEAIGFIKDGLEIIEGRDATSVDAISVMYRNLGTLHRVQGDFEEALRYYRHALALDIEKNGEKDHTISSSYRMIGRALIYQKKYQEAKTYYQKALAILTEEYPGQYPADKLDVYNRLVVIAIKQGRMGHAHKYLQLGEGLLRQFPKIRGRENTRSIHADYLMQMGELAKSKQLLDDALALYTGKYGKNATNPVIASVYRLYAKLHLRAGHYKDALQALQSAFEVLAPGYEAQDMMDMPPLPTLLNSQDALYVMMLKVDILSQWCREKPGDIGLLKSAHRNYKLLVKLASSLRQSYQHEESKLYWAENHAKTYEGAIETAYQLYERTQDDAYAEEAFALMEQSRAKLLYDALLNTKAKFGLPDSLRAKEQAMGKQLLEYDKILRDTLNKNPAFLGEIKSKKFALKQVYQNLTYKLELNYPAYERQKYAADSTVATIAQVQRLLGEAGSAFLTYFTGDSVIYTYAITPKGHKIYKQDKPAWFEKAILAIHGIFGDFSATMATQDSTYVTNAYRLYQLLLQKPLEDMPDHPERLILVPEGILNYVPFQALIQRMPVDFNGIRYNKLAYVLRQYSISYKYSATYWIGQSKYGPPRQFSKPWVGFAAQYSKAQLSTAVGQPALGVLATRSQGWQLPFAKREVQTIARLTGGQVFTDLEGTESSFYHAAGKYQVIHLANHGLVHETDPQYNNLVFAEEMDAANDGKLHAYEVYGLSLNADMAVLSACNTGMGKLQKGEGVMSLARAFSYAGCKSLVMSLWLVPDRATSAIMVDFYKGIWAGKPKDIALKDAQLAYLDAQEESIYAHPYFWASFVPMGIMKPLAIAHGNLGYWPWVCGTLVLCGVGIWWTRKRKVALRARLNG